MADEYPVLFYCNPEQKREDDNKCFICEQEKELIERLYAFYEVDNLMALVIHQEEYIKFLKKTLGF